MANRKSLIQRRAESEMQVVITCVGKYEAKEVEINDEIAELEKVLKELKAEGRTAPAYKKEQLFNKCRNYEDAIKSRTNLLTLFNVTIYVLQHMINGLDHYYNREDFRKIVKMVPKRLIMKYAKDPKKLEKLKTIGIELYKQMQRDLAIVGIVLEDLELEQATAEHTFEQADTLAHGGKTAAERKAEKEAGYDAYFAEPVEVNAPTPVVAEEDEDASRPNRA